MNKREDKMNKYDFNSKDVKDFTNNGLCFKLLLHENELFTNRINLFLLAESLLFLSYVTTLVNIQINNCISVLINILGIAITILFGYVIVRHANNLESLKTTIDEYFPFHKKIRGRRTGIPTNIVLSWILIFVFLITWLILFVLILNC